MTPRQQTIRSLVVLLAFLGLGVVALAKGDYVLGAVCLVVSAPTQVGVLRWRRTKRQADDSTAAEFE